MSIESSPALLCCDIQVQYLSSEELTRQDALRIQLFVFFFSVITLFHAAIVVPPRKLQVSEVVVTDLSFHQPLPRSAAKLRLAVHHEFLFQVIIAKTNLFKHDKCNS